MKGQGTLHFQATFRSDFSRASNFATVLTVLRLLPFSFCLRVFFRCGNRSTPPMEEAASGQRYLPFECPVKSAAVDPWDPPLDTPGVLS